MEVALAFVVAVTISSVVWFLSSYLGELPTHNGSKRYQELRRLPDSEVFEVVRSFQYRRNAKRWVDQCVVKGCVIQLRDSKTGRVLRERKEQ